MAFRTSSRAEQVATMEALYEYLLWLDEVDSRGHNSIFWVPCALPQNGNRGIAMAGWGRLCNEVRRTAPVLGKSADSRFVNVLQQ